MVTNAERPVSVIVSNYNYERYLSESILSVLNQTYTNIQVIVVDDGSTDNSKQSLESIQDCRLQIIYQNNSGQASAFNAAFTECTGEFIAFLDSDDFWFERKLEVCVPFFDEGNISLVQHNLQVVGKDSKPCGGIHPNIEPGRKSIKDSYFKDNHTGFFSATSGMICRKADLDRIFPLDTSWKICADVAFSRPLPIFGDIVTLDEILGGYRMHGDNFWMHSKEQENWLENQQRYVDFTNNWLVRCGFKEKIFFEKSDHYMMYSQKCGIPVPFFRKAGYWFRKAKRKLGNFSAS